MPEKNNFQLDFLGIGAPRAGSTWLAECLREHPQICLSSPKEVHFFGTEKFQQFGFNWYKKHFNCKKDQLKGEFDPGYLYSEAATEQIKKNFPDIKLIVCLRNPIERTFSNHLMVSGFNKNILSFDKQIKQKPKTLERSLYYGHLKRYLQNFPQKNILILFYEDLKQDKQATVKKLYRFLKVDENFLPSCLNRKSNASKKYRYPSLKIYTGKLIKWLSKRKFGVYVVNLLRKIGGRKMFNFLDKINSQKMERPRINRQTREYLKEYYREDIKNLERLLNKDLSFWE